jgi:hypothetical protein
MKIKFIVLVGLVSCLYMNDTRGMMKSSAKAKVPPRKNVPAGLMKSGATRQYLPGRVIVKLKPNRGLAKATHSFGVASLDEFVQRYSVQSVSQVFEGHKAPANSDEVDLTRFYVMKYSSPMDAFVVCKELSQHPDVEYAEPWYIYAVDACPTNDSLRSQQWALTKMMMDSAWCISSGDTSVIIGIIDTGVQWDHPDLAANIYINPGEYGPDGHGGRKESNGIDDDGDGYVDDWHGWDFGGADTLNPIQDNNPAPTGSNNGHGTETGGVASAATNNHTGIAGVGYKCKILPVKTTSDNDTRANGQAYIVFWLQGLVYAADMGATVANCSFGGGGGASQAEQEIINYATQKGTLVVAAAGNDGVIDPSYPAAYDNVISAASTNSADRLSTSFSNYGPTVDVCAPGEAIMTTVYPNGYGSATGTSFSAPNTSGIAALVKSLHPTYTALQVGEQVRISCDDIYPLNPGYEDYLGRGRVNAVNALTVSSPSVRMSSYTISDSVGGNNNGILEPGETIAIYATFTNYLAATTSNAKVMLISTNDNALHVIDTVFTIGALSTLGTATNNASPFRLKINSVIGVNAQIYLKLIFQDGSYSDFQFFRVLVNPLYATHNVNNVVFSVSNFGSLGYYDYVNQSSFGEGFQYPAGTPSALYHATLMVGTDPNHVSDNAYGDSLDNAVDFRVAARGNFALLKEHSADQVFKCAFTDSGVTPLSKRLGLYVTQRSYAYKNSPDDAYVTVRYDIRNISPSVISNAYVGVYADWDVVDASTNLIDYDATRRLGYQWDPNGSAYYGLCLVNPTTAASYRAVDNSSYIYNGFSDRNKYLFMSQGFGVTSDATAGDWSMVLSAGPFTINSGDSVTVGYAFIGGDDLAGLQAHADAAIAKWQMIMGVNKDGRNGIPITYALGQNYPNPFNPTTEITYDLPSVSRVSLTVFDVLGREVATLVNGEQPAGSYRVPFNASRLSSGVYFYRLTADAVSSSPQQSYTNAKKLLLVR